MNTSCKLLALIALTQLLLACGGGGSGGGSSGPVASTPSLNSSSAISLSSAADTSSAASVISSSAVSNSSLNASTSSVNSSPNSSAASSSSLGVSTSSSSRISSSARSSSSSSSRSSSVANSSVSSVSSISSSASSQVANLAAPKNLVVSAANQGVGVQWSPVAGASTYNIFYATESGINAQNITASNNGAWVGGVTSPYVISGLNNNQTYYFVVTAVNAQGEGVQSAEVSARPSAITQTHQPSPQEVLILELTNRARFDPEAEALRYGIGLNDGGTNISSARKQPLAHNTQLIRAAREHSQWMLDNDVFSHTGLAGSTPTERIQAAGYGLTGSWTTAENISWQGTTGSSINMTQAAVQHHESLFKSAGHRINILNNNYRELGVGQLQGMFLYQGTNYLSSMVTQNFARSGTSYFISGVIYQDNNANDFYDVGEGISGAVITVNGQAYSVLSTGAYALPITNGTYTLAIGGAALGEVVQHTVQIDNANRKLDLIKRGNNIEVKSW